MSPPFFSQSSPSSNVFSLTCSSHLGSLAQHHCWGVGKMRPWASLLDHPLLQDPCLPPSCPESPILHFFCQPSSDELIFPCSPLTICSMKTGFNFMAQDGNFAPTCLALLGEHQECVFVISVNAPSYQWMQGNPSSSPSQFIATSPATLWACEESGTEGGRNKDYKMKDAWRLWPKELCLYNNSAVVFLTASFKVSRGHRSSFSFRLLPPFLEGGAG